VIYGDRWLCDVTEDRFEWHCVCHPDADPYTTFRWVNEGKKVVWWEVPRAGSSSIQATISVKHSKDWRLIELHEVDTFRYVDYFNFAVLRNPWDRVVSCYELYKTYKGGPGSRRIEEMKLLFGKIPKFEEFVERMFDEGSRNHHWCPVSCFVPDEDAGFGWLAIPMEKLTPWWNKIAKNYGFSEMERIEGPATRGPDRKPYQDYYNDTTRALIEEYYSEDIRRFGYTFEG